MSFEAISSLLAGIEGVESVVQEFFSENGLSVIRNDIPGVKVVLSVAPSGALFIMMGHYRFAKQLPFEMYDCSNLL